MLNRLETFCATYGVTCGPHNPQRVASLPVFDQFEPHNRAFVRSRAASLQRLMARGSTLTAVLLNRATPQAFDPQMVRMPVFHAYAPLGLAEPRYRIVRALVAQQCAQLAVNHAQMLGACILLSRREFARAWSTFTREDHQARLASMQATEFVLGLILYGAILACERVGLRR